MIKIIETKKGAKMYYKYAQKAMMWQRIKAAEAELLLASEQCILVPANHL